MVAERLDVEWISETLHERNLIDVMDAALDHIDEPLADPSFLPTFLLSRLAARHVKVVVGGDGGDELWGGYPTYRAHRYAADLRGASRRWIRKYVVGRARRAAADRRSLPEPGVEAAPVHEALGRRHGDAPPALDVQRRPARSGARDPGGEGRCCRRRWRRRCPRRDDWLQRILALDFSTYMPGSVLTKVDRASMAHGLEVRPPLLDDALMDWSFSLPSQLQAAARRRASTCSSWRRAARSPTRSSTAPRRASASRWRRWLRGPLKDRIDEVVARSPAFDRGILDGDVFRGWNASTRRSAPTTASRLWALLVLDHWLGATANPPRGDLPRMATTNEPARVPRSLRLRVVDLLDILPESQGPARTLARRDGARELPRQARHGRRLRHGRNPYWFVEAGAHSVLGVDVDDGSLAAARAEPRAVRQRARREVRRRRSGPRGARHLRSRHLHRRAAPPRRARARAREDVELRRPGGDLVLWCYAQGRQSPHLAGDPVAPRDRLAPADRRQPRDRQGRRRAGLAGDSVAPLRTDYYRRLRTLSFSNVESIIFDQMLPHIAHYWTRDDMHRLASLLDGGRPYDRVRAGQQLARAIISKI